MSNGNRTTRPGSLWNARYVAYAKAHDTTPARMLAGDRKRYQGGRMAGFISWISGRWCEWEKENGRKPHDAKSAADHAAFDAWLRGELFEVEAA